MSAPALRLHARLYRARAVAEAVRVVEESLGVALERRREGEHHVVVAPGASEEVAGQALGEVGNAALVLTVEADRR